MSVARVSEITRIRQTVIHGIERDNFSLCGGDFYARGHIRNLAICAGIDPIPLVRQFDEVHAGAAPVVPASGVFNAAREVRLRGSRLPNWVGGLTVAVGVLAVFGALRVLGGGPEEQPPATGLSAPATLTPTTGPTAQAAPPPTPTPAREKPRKDKVTVRVTTSMPSWMFVRDAKGRSLFRGTLRPGHERTWKSAKIKAVFENAGAVRLMVDGQKLEKLGKARQTVRKTFLP